MSLLNRFSKRSRVSAFILKGCFMMKKAKNFILLLKFWDNNVSEFSKLAENWWFFMTSSDRATFVG